MYGYVCIDKDSGELLMEIMSSLNKSNSFSFYQVQLG